MARVQSLSLMRTGAVALPVDRPGWVFLAVLGKILVLVAIILFIQKRPRGLFALKGRAVES